MRAIKPILATVASLAAMALTAAPALANSPWWNLASGSRPARLPAEAGSKADIFVTAADLGTAAVDGESQPVVIEDRLPAGLKPLSIGGVSGQGNEVASDGPVECKKETLTCTFASTLPAFDQIEIRIRVEVKAGAETGEENAVSVSGGDAAPRMLSRPIVLSGEPAPFGLDENVLQIEEPGGVPASGAATHPFQVTDSLALNQLAASGSGAGYKVAPVALPKDVRAELPPGFLGDPSPFPTCSMAQFLTLVNNKGNECPLKSVLGVAAVSFYEPSTLGFVTATVPVFNLEPAFGEPAHFAFLLPATPVVLDVSLRGGGPHPDYGVTVSSTNISQVAALLTSRITFWGVPGDPRHDGSRGWGCLEAAHGKPEALPCPPSEEPHPPAFLTLPTACSGSPLSSDTLIDSWPKPANVLTAPMSLPLPTLDSCNQVPFTPTISAKPTSNSATSPTGFDFGIDVNDEGLLSASGKAQSQIKKAVVTLPEGFTANPSVAEGLKACGQAEYEAATVEPGTGCNSESKIGEVEIESPLVEARTERVVKGGLYVAKQKENPYGNLLTLYIIARAPELGVLVRQALKVTPDPVTGQLTTEVDDIPQLPFNRFHLSFRPGQRSPLITPPACGTYQVKAELFPWSAPEAPRIETAQFTVTQGPEGTPCPTGGLPPFKPNLVAGSLNNAAGHYSPFYIHITRHDSEQEITHFSIKLPPGVVGKLAGVPQCSDAQIAAAKAREHEGGGAEEQASPSCPAASEVGHTLVGTGVGNVLAYAPGKVYLAGPYHGSSLSVVAITSAVVGPFDLGTVVVREALRVNPETGEVFVDATGSDPIPHIVDGIPTHLRDIRIYMDKPEFVLNPTSCEPTSTASTVLGAGLNFSSEADDVPITVTSPFQAADCAALPFVPRLSFKLLGGTRRGANPAFRAHLVMNGIGEAAIAKTVVTLPKSEFLENEHIRTICTRVQFKEGAGNGSNCPAGSVYGYARAVTPILAEPLEGPVFLRSSEHELPDLVAALRGNEITVDLVGRIDSIGGGIRTSFESVPDAPVSEFTLEMAGGQKSLLVNSTSLCTGAHRASVRMEAHNGKVLDSAPKLGAKCSARKHKHKGKKRHRVH